MINDVALLDEHGISQGLVPAFVTERTLERWLVCAILAAQFTGQPDGHPENRMFAEVLFDMDVPTGEIELDEPQGEIEEGLFDALAVARARAAALWRRADHPRNRLGRFIETSDGTITGRPRPSFPVQRSPGTFYSRADIQKAGLDKWPEKGQAAREILGDAKDTAEIHATGEQASPGTITLVPYSPERTKVHDEWIAKFFEGKTPVPEGQPRHAVFMAGGTATGKSTTLEANTPPKVPQEESIVPPEEHTIHIDADKIKEMSSEYQQMRAAKDRYAATALHRESGDVAARMIVEAMEKGFHVVIDGTGNHDLGSFSRHLRDANDAGYRVDVIYVNAPTDWAIAWAIERAEKTGRFVPVDVIRRIHAKVSRNFVEEISGLDFLDSIEVFDRGEHIATWENGSFIPLDLEKFAAFVAKKDEVDLDGE